jgi:cobalt-zinc-cadmium efflux system membrane fusion protein
VRRSITLGETVTAGDSSAKVLFTIVDDSVVWADIAVYKQDISRVRIGAPVALKSDAGDIMAQSTVAFVLPVIDEVSRTATARVIVDNSDRTLTPGQFVIADLSVGNAAEVLRVPQSAVQLVEDRPSVFVPVDGGFAPRAVMVGTTAGGYVEIKTGLEEDELYVSEGAFTLKAQLEKDAFGDGHGH